MSTKNRLNSSRKGRGETRPDSHLPAMGDVKSDKADRKGNTQKGAPDINFRRPFFLNTYCLLPATHLLHHASPVVFSCEPWQSASHEGVSYRLADVALV